MFKAGQTSHPTPESSGGLHYGTRSPGLEPTPSLGLLKEVASRHLGGAPGQGSQGVPLQTRPARAESTAMAGMVCLQAVKNAVWLEGQGDPEVRLEAGWSQCLNVKELL